MHGSFVSSGTKVVRRRVLNVSCRASYKNPLGLHSNVWMGAWDKKAAERSIKQTKKLGYGLIEGGDLLYDWETVIPGNCADGCTK